MKRMKKLLSIMMAVIMILAMAAPAYADGGYSITVSKDVDTSVSIEGNTYTAYKMFDVTYNSDKTAYSYELTSDFTEFTYTYNNVEYKGDADDGENNLVALLETMGDDSVELNAFSVAVYNYIKDNSIASAGTATVEAGQTSATIELDTAGYYVVAGTATNTEESDNDSVTALCALTTTKPSASVTVKADAPSIDKKIVEGANKVTVNNAAIGDTVSYEITSEVPKMTGYTSYSYKVTDTLAEGLTYKEGSLKVMVGGTEKTADSDNETNDYSLDVQTDGTTGVTTIVIDFHNFVDYTAGQAIVITYQATLNISAKVGVEANINEVKLEYSSDPNDANQKNETPAHKVFTYVTGVKIDKYRLSGNDKVSLAGAEFKLESENGELNIVVMPEGIKYVEDGEGIYYKLKSGAYTTVSPDDENAYLYVEPDAEGNYQKYSVGETPYTFATTGTDAVDAQAFVTAEGSLIFKGLPAGSYELTEVTAPEGYNILKAPIAFTITFNGQKQGSEKANWSVDENSGATIIAETDDDGKELENAGYVHIEVENKSGSELPSTGGIGTTIFTVSGLILMLGAGILLVTKRRMSAKDL